MGKPIEGRSYCISSLAISSDGNYIVSGSGGGTIRRWDAGIGEEVCKDIELPDLVKKIVISNDSETIACASKYDNYVH